MQALQEGLREDFRACLLVDVDDVSGRFGGLAIRSGFNKSLMERFVRFSISARTSAGMIPRMPPPSTASTLNAGAISPHFLTRRAAGGR
ncbi:MAG: hypothetical protein LC797_20675 [Chloroflexi bacterium]|nr:hypothetical protein [Chloroflexota bacterium]